MVARRAFEVAGRTLEGAVRPLTGMELEGPSRELGGPLRDLGGLRCEGDKMEMKTVVPLDIRHPILMIYHFFASKQTSI